MQSYLSKASFATCVTHDHPGRALVVTGRPRAPGAGGRPAEVLPGPSPNGGVCGRLRQRPHSFVCVGTNDHIRPSGGGAPAMANADGFGGHAWVGGFGGRAWAGSVVSGQVRWPLVGGFGGRGWVGGSVAAPRRAGQNQVTRA